MSHGYGQFCPLAKAAEVLCERWTLLVVRELTAGSRGFNELRRGLPLISPTLLSRRLKHLADAGVVCRARDEANAKDYELTDAGRELQPLVERMATWGHRWVGSRLEEDDLDVGLLMWDIRRGVDGSRFPERQTVVQVRFSDAPDGQRDWWLVAEGGETDLCMEDPGHEIDLLLETSVRTLTAIWLCQCTLARAERERRLRILGDRSLKRELPAWLPGSPLARLGEASLREHPIG
ncbi:MAG: transcriptional regulator [Gammaproteobacteria bacterium]|jgi:DNA-binding HxlR family transcriptional regulator|nr:transcriptional regulator [Gammaproteobacteria bacterium]